MPPHFRDVGPGFLFFLGRWNLWLELLHVGLGGLFVATSAAVKVQTCVSQILLLPQIAVVHGCETLILFYAAHFAPPSKTLRSGWLIETKRKGT